MPPAALPLTRPPGACVRSPPQYRYLAPARSLLRCKDLRAEKPFMRARFRAQPAARGTGTRTHRACARRRAARRESARPARRGRAGRPRPVRAPRPDGAAPLPISFAASRCRICSGATAFTGPLNEALVEGEPVDANEIGEQQSPGPPPPTSDRPSGEQPERQRHHPDRLRLLGPRRARSARQHGARRPRRRRPPPRRRRRGRGTSRRPETPRPAPRCYRRRSSRSRTRSRERWACDRCALIVFDELSASSRPGSRRSPPFAEHMQRLPPIEVPARLTTASAPSTSLCRTLPAHAPRPRKPRERTTTSCPSFASERTSACQTSPEPPPTTTFM